MFDDEMTAPLRAGDDGMTGAPSWRAAPSSKRSEVMPRSVVIAVLA
ncbi:MAG: hypothetical protein Q4G70_08805 [Pseudomonadota bacterium]|nr:hypothetical protein [Pseudomonadota bacterium]